MQVDLELLDCKSFKNGTLMVSYRVNTGRQKRKQPPEKQKKKAGASLTRPALTGTAGVSPASSNGFMRGAVELFKCNKVAFNESGRGARGPSKSGPSFCAGFLTGYPGSIYQ
jgi:hypothetical protein